jgi:hypothetical protein
MLDTLYLERKYFLLTYNNKNIDRKMKTNDSKFARSIKNKKGKVKNVKINVFECDLITELSFKNLYTKA